MLSSLTLNNVALIKKQNIEFQSGFNCLLGASGAGKSIIIDALSFVLGAKADKGLIRTGETLLRVDAVFDELTQEQKDFLMEEEIEFDDEIIVTRTLTVEGKSSVKINGYPVTLKVLQVLGQSLADFCGQHDSVGLLQPSNHLYFLDKFAGEVVDKLKVDVATAYDALKETEKKISELGGSEEQRARTKELLQYQIQEIENANLSVGEEEELKERFNFISSAENIFEKVSDALTKLDGQTENVVGLLYEAKGELGSFSNFKEIEEYRDRLEGCYYEVKDIVDGLEGVKDRTEYDPKELERIDSRLDLIKNLSRKYGKGVEEILNFCQSCKAQLEELENSEFLLEKLGKEKSVQEKTLLDLSEKLSLERQKSAKILEKQLTSQLDDLEMKGTYFKVNFERTDFSRKGYDNVKFMFSANVGQEIKDLHKTASGGELSRLLLAFKNVMLGSERVQTVIFDEIDAGISGHIAGRLAEKLSNIAKYTQVICITHTPVVASKANAYLLVEKSVHEGQTISSVRTLSSDEAVVEVARLIDGTKNISATAIEHVKKLFEQKNG
ncbi:MAG: DNA repair protein RecN [Candidatus Caccovivens sp.]